MDELPKVLWAYWTTSRRPIGATSFAFDYGMEVIIPTEIGMPIVKIAVQDQKNNDEELIRQLDWADKMWGDVTIRMTSYHQRTITQYSKKAWPQFFWLGTLILRRIFKSTVEIGVRKLQANWKGPYAVTKAGDSMTYHLQTLDDVPLLRPWNVVNLKQYYQ